MPIQAPQWTEYLNCPVCSREFGPPPRSPISLGCGHTLCRHCLKHLHRKRCPFDQTIIQPDFEDLVTNTSILQLAGYPPPAQPYHPPCIKALPEQARHSYDFIIHCLENLAAYLKFCGTTTNGISTNRLSRPMQRKLISLIQCAMTDQEGRGRAARAARSLGERTVTELILQHQNPQQLSANLWAAVRARGCQFLGPAMQEEVLKLVLLALEDGSALSRKVLVMFVVQRLEPHFPQASKTSIGHVVQLLYRASCFKVSKRESDSSLMQLKEEFRSYELLRREHDAQIVQIATEAGLRIAPDQWSSLLYGDTVHKSHMQSTIDKLQTPASFSQSVQELFIALQRSGDSPQLLVLSVHLERLATIEPTPDAKCPSLKQLAEIMSSLNEVVTRLVQYLQQQTTARDVTHNAKHLNVNVETKQASAGTGNATPSHGRYKVSMCRDTTQRSFCPRGNACTFAHTEEELERFRSIPAAGPIVVTGNYNYMVPSMPPSVPPPPPAIFTSFPLPALHPMPTHISIPDSYSMSPLAQMSAPVVMASPEIIQSQDFENARVSDSIQPLPNTLSSEALPSSRNFSAPMMQSSPVGLAPVLAQSGAAATGAPPSDRFYHHYPLQQYHTPNTSTFNPVVEVMAPALPPGIVVSYVSNEVDASHYAFDDHAGEPRPEMIPMYRLNTMQPLPPLDRHPGILWPAVNNNMYKFNEMVHALPRQNANEEMFNVPASDRRVVGADRVPTVGAVNINKIADDQELEEELQALERRIDTEFKSTD